MSGTEYENPKDSVCTNFRVEDGYHTVNGQEVWTWSFKCTRCGHRTPCRGNPEGFGGRPYSCANCAWVSLLDQDAIESFAEAHYPDFDGKNTGDHDD